LFELQALDHGVGHRSRGEGLRSVEDEVRGSAAVFERLRDRDFEGECFALEGQAVAKEKGNTENGAEGIGDAFASDVRGRSVDGFVKATFAFSQRRTGKKAE